MPDLNRSNRFHLTLINEIPDLGALSLFRGTSVTGAKPMIKTDA